jgi:Zn-dependent peptidase ImmA (M78 family)/transcriptional regulator with XRE-family HTH domain
MLTEIAYTCSREGRTVSREQRGSSSDVQRHLAENIRGRREQLGLTQADLAARAGFSAPQIVSSIERNEREVKAVELAAIAQALHCDLMDLFASEDDHEVAPIVAWRERPTVGAEDQAARFLQLCQWYALAEAWANEERDCDLPDVRPPRGTPTVSWARSIAEDVRNALGLGSLPAASLYQTLEERCGVKIFYFDDLTGSAACARGDFGAGIALNATEVPWRRNFSLAHELFHLVTWDYLSPQQEDTDAVWSAHIETLANAFASSLLLPEAAVLKSLEAHRDERSITWRGLVEVAREFDVSTEALLWRLVSLNMVSEKQVRQLLDNPGFRDIDRMTFAPIRAPDLLPERYLRLLETAYLRGEVSAGRVAEMTSQSLADVHHKLTQLEEVEGDTSQLVRLA